MLSRTIFHASKSSIRAPRTQLQKSFSSFTRPSAFPISRSAAPPLSTRLSPRWYSDAAETKPADKSEASTKDEAASPPVAEIEALKKDVEAKNKEIIDLKDKYLRSVADYRNLQDRTKRETQAARDFALQKFAKDLVSSIDNFEHALRGVPAEKIKSPPTAASDSAEYSPEALHKDLVNLHKGLELTESAMLNTLKRHGITRFDPSEAGEKFDPNTQEAVFHAPMQGKEDGTVFHTQQKGFLLNGRVLRAAQVGVVKNPS